MSSDQDNLITEWLRSDAHTSARRSTAKRTSRLYSGYVSRQKSRRREVRNREPKHQITVDTSFTTHRGRAPREVYLEGDERSYGLMRKQSWFGMRRFSGHQKGLGITRGTPQPEAIHRYKESIDRNEPTTAASSRTFPDISPWDRQIPIGISVPTDSIPDFSPSQESRYRSGSDATLVTPSIVVTPAVPMQSVWSPDTPFSEPDYTPSAYSHKPGSFNIPPMPALPAVIPKAPAVHNFSVHNRSDTLDSAGTAFEEDYDLGGKARVLSTATMFEEDVTPLREQTIETTLALDTTVVPPTLRSSEGWWNLITTPFIMTPNTATFPNGQQSAPFPDVPMLPTHYYTSEDAPASPSTYTWSAADSASFKPSLSTAVTTPETKQAETVQVKEQNSILAVIEEHHHMNIMQAAPASIMHPPFQKGTSPTRHPAALPSSATPTPPTVNAATIGTVLMPRQVKKQPQQININIELQDKRPITHSQTVQSTGPLTVHPTIISVPASQTKEAELATLKYNNSQQALPTFAPPPTFTKKGTQFSYDDKRSGSPTPTADPKASKKPSKVQRFMRFLHFGRKQHKSPQKKEEDKKKKKRGKGFWGCCCCLVFVILLAILIPMIIVLTQRHNKSNAARSGQGINFQWFNLPNYPPVPVGISTVAQPEPVEEESGCVAPTTLWSCALPKELQASVQPNQPDQPNFKIQILYQNGTAADLSRRAANPVSVRPFIRSQLNRIRSINSPSPAPPSVADMNFLGQTTDGNSAPFEGEATPLLISLQNPQGSKLRLAKRSDPSDPTNITAVIPPPTLNPDGSAAAANLLSFPSAQPLRLFNRGQDSEYYGFYTYFDRSIFLKDINGTNRGGNPADTNGGSTQDAANLRCTYAETRLLVQIWTRSTNSKPLLQHSASNASNVFSRPGTFPYPVTITIDRHGGNAARKNLYCYDIESDGTIKNDASKRFFEFEDRAFGGNLVGGTQGQTNATGLIDGGSGGCRCKWQNWLG